ncbi:MULTISPECIES: thioredoxin family protein [Thiorhodovibrio]|uniref:thioredoxin family protein n=1 Tax=Thiorhodovibrio TaxID=61593 RepID=UPI0019122750|nr:MULTISPECIES: thioredoxin family protein [Thiorhodovibrio]MBK5970542.1 thiol reductase thioredoxin [Thiorhodovibrio winogradskyi]
MSAHHHACPHAFLVGHDDFDTAVVQASHHAPMLVDFWADWCGPCHALTPHLYRVLDEYQGRLRLAQIEVDEGENMKIAGHYRVRGFPTVMLFCGGEEHGRFSGSRSATQIRDWLEQHLPACPK